MISSLPVLVAFTHRLREEGIPVSAGIAGQMVEALSRVGMASAEDSYYAMRSLACSSVDHLRIFDRVFSVFFAGRIPPVIATVGPRNRDWAIKPVGVGEGQAGEEEKVASTTGASLVERLGHRDFAKLSNAEAAEVKVLIARMVWSPALIESRRRKPFFGGDLPDLRKTLRGAVGPESDVIRLEYTTRRIRRRPLIFIADVSGSMERYAEMLLYFAHAARGRLGRLEAFVFSTHLTRITRQLSRRDPGSAIAEVSEAVNDWSSGTKIGESIGTFNREWSRRVCRGGPIVLIISDGWERGDPRVLADEMARLRRTVHRVVWLNPIAGRAHYVPATRGMRAALPYVDDFLPAANLADLTSVVTLLESIPPYRTGTKTAIALGAGPEPFHT
ncbi:MAG: vWA domain-containing protein [Acidimicrobiia bacterium]